MLSGITNDRAWFGKAPLSLSGMLSSSRSSSFHVDIDVCLNKVTAGLHGSVYYGIDGASVCLNKYSYRYETVRQTLCKRQDHFNRNHVCLVGLLFVAQCRSSDGLVIKRV